MIDVTIKKLLEAGVHFGHQTQRWNPKMKSYIFGERNGIYIINLEITLKCLDKALLFLKQVASEGREILFVGTKRQAQGLLREAAERCEMPYVDQRWLGGALTNFETVRKSVARLDHIDQMEQEGNFQYVTKKEANMLRKEREKLLKNLKGIRKMKRLPAAIFVIDSNKEEIAIREAAKLGIPIVSVLDTNCDPDLVTYPVPGNDDAIRAIRLFCDFVSDSIKKGRDQYMEIRATEEAVTEEALGAAEAPKEVPPEGPEVTSVDLEKEGTPTEATLGKISEEAIEKPKTEEAIEKPKTEEAIEKPKTEEAIEEPKTLEEPSGGEGDEIKTKTKLKKSIHKEGSRGK